MTEEWPVRPAARLFYAQEKAELERLLRAEATRTETAGAEEGGPGANRAASPGPDLYLLRPPVVLGPHAVGAKDLLPGPLAPLGRILAGRIRRSPVPLPALVPLLPLQLVHEDDLGQALLRCVLAAGPPGAYNIAADGIQHRRRRPGVRPVPAALAWGTGPAGGPCRRRAAVPAARRPVGGGGQSPGDHGHHQGEAGPGLGSPLHRPGSPAGHPATAAG